MPFLDTSDSVSIFYTTDGDRSNPPILLIHGWSCDSHDWSWQILFLTKTHFVIALDLRGHGRSNAPETAPFTAQAFVSDAATLLRHLGFEKDVIVMGHSMGGITTSAFSVLEPELTKAVIIIDPPYWRSGAECDASIPTVKPVGEHNWALAAYGALTAGDVPDWMKTWYNRRVLGTPAHVIGGCVPGIFGGEGGLGRAEVHEKLVSGRECPRLAIYIDEENAEKERGLGMGSLDEVVVIPGVGHWPHQVRSEEVNGILEKWLKKIENA